MSFNDDIEAAKEKLAALDKKAVPRAMAMAINKVATKVVNRGITRTAKVVDVPKKLIKGRVKLDRAKPSRLSAFIKINRGNLPLIRVIAGKASPFIRKGANKGQLKVGKRIYARAFIQKLANGRTHVLQRLGKERYPIDVVKIPLTGPLTESFETEIKNAYQTDMPKEMRSALNYQIKLVVKD